MGTGLAVEGIVPVGTGLVVVGTDPEGTGLAVEGTGHCKIEDCLVGALDLWIRKQKV